MPGDNRDWLFDCAEEFVKYTITMREHFGLFRDRFSERGLPDSGSKVVTNGVGPRECLIRTMHA